MKHMYPIYRNTFKSYSLLTHTW